jgi:transposase InsO family protein
VKLQPFIEAEKTIGRSVKRACELFEVSRAAFYQRLDPTPSPRAVADGELTDKITEIHATSMGTYGSPRVHAELAHQGEAVGRRRVARLMRQEGLEGRAKKKWRKTTVADPDAEAAKDLIARSFAPGGDIDARYVGDITYIATWEGWAYLATVIDLASRKVVGWSLADHMRTELVTDALNMAFAHRQPPAGLIFHSDRGCQAVHQHRLQPARPRPRRRAVGRPQGRMLGQRGGRIVLRDDQTRAH